MCILQACGPGTEEVINEFRPKYNDLISKIISTVDAADQNELLKENKSISPNPVFGQFDDAGANMALIMDKEIRDLTFNPEKEEDVIGMPWSDYRICIRYISPRVNINNVDDVHGGEATKLTLEQGLKMKYLLYIKTLSFTKPGDAQGGEFEGGEISFMAYIIDLNDFSIKAQFMNYAKSSDEIGGSINNIQSDLWDNAEDVLKENLLKYTNTKMAKYSF